MAKTTPNPFTIFTYARQYMFAEEKLRDTEISDLIIRFSNPSLVLSAFASELLLKCLRSLEAPTVPTGHDLSKLFDGLRPATKDNIAKRWEARIALISDQLDIIERHGGNKLPRDFLTALGKCKDAFTLLRYQYEHPSVSTFYMHDLPDVLFNVILERKPEWEFATGFQKVAEIPTVVK